MEELTRAFICIDFPSEVIKEIIRVQEELEKIGFKGKLTEPENLHLTLKFLGEINKDNLEKIREKLRGIKFNAMELRLGDAGTFNIRGNPRIAWIKVLGEGIWELQKEIDKALEDIFPKEERFMSHLTIARVKYVDDKKFFSEKVKNLGVRGIGFTIGGFKLMKSELKIMGPNYTVIEEYGAEN